MENMAQNKKAVAIIGMAGKMPQANDLQTFWSNIQRGKDGVTEIPKNRWDWRAYFGDGGCNHSKWGGFISDVDQFDASFFGIPPKEAEFIDPQHRLFLETSWHTLEDAGYRPSELSGKRISVFVGVSTQDYRQELYSTNVEMDSRISTGLAVSMVANRVSFLLNFTGPSDISDTACSSSLVAVHRGIQSIYNEGCEMALVGGVNLILIPEVMVAFGKTGMLTEEKEVRTFDQQAQGYIRGEGVGALLLKPLSQAEADHDSIYAVIRGSAVNHSGHGYSLTSPDLKGQTQVIVDAYQEAGIAPSTVNYIEAHGTATQAGDNIEVRAFKKAFDKLGHDDFKKKCKIGALKPDIGHLESASGVASLIKVILAMKHRIKPGVKNFEQLNPLIKLKNTPFYINNIHESWETFTDKYEKELPRRASVHAFGFSGVNAHLVMEEWNHSSPLPWYNSPENRLDAKDGEGPHLIVLSAKNKKSLLEATRNIQQYTKNSLSLADLAYTLQVGREEMDVRLGLLVESVQELREKLDLWLSGQLKIPGVFYGDIRDPDQTCSNNESAWEITNNLQSLAKQWVQGMSIDWSLLYDSNTRRRLTGLPGYPFEKQRCWVVDPVSAESCEQPALLKEEDDLSALLKKILQKVSGYQSDQFAANLSFIEMGFDSLLLTEFKNRLESYIQLEIPIEVLYEQDTLEKLALYLRQHLSKDHQANIFHHTSQESKPFKRNPLLLAPLQDTYPVSAEQLRYWNNHQLTKEDHFNHSLSIPVCLEINNRLSVVVLKKALQHIVRRQEILRTIFIETPQGLRQQVLAYFEPSVSQWKIEKKDNPAYQQTIDDFIMRKWELTSDPLWRIGLIFQEEKTILLFTMHHIIGDLWSVQLFFRELSKLYSAWGNIEPNPLPIISHQYTDFACQEEAFRSGKEWQRRKIYWQNLLAEPWEELALPYKKNKQRQLKNKSGEMTLILEASLTQKILDFCHTHHWTAFTLFLSALELLLYGLTEQKRLIVGTSLQNRNHVEWEPVMGCFTQVSFTLLKFDGAQTLQTVMEQVHDNVLNIRSHALSYSETTGFLQKSKPDPLCPAVQVMFNHVKSTLGKNQLFEAESQFVPLKRPFLDFDLALTLNEQKNNSRLFIEYAQNLFEARTIEQFGKQFKQVLTWMIQSPEARVENIFEQLQLTRRKSICIAATFTAELVKTSLQYWMKVLGESVNISFANFNQVFQELLDPNSLLRQNERGVNVLLLRLSDWLGSSQNFHKTVKEWIETLQAALNHSKTPYLVLICPVSPDLENKQIRMMEEAEQKIVKVFQENRQVTVFTQVQMQQIYTVENVHNVGLDQLGSIPYSKTYNNVLGTTIARQCFNQWSPIYKVLIVDGDQTLWKGVVGENGVDGISLDDGRYRFQQKLVTLQQSGMLLCLCSKNVEADILTIFEKRQDFPLKKEHFVALKVNWESKSSNLKTLATELNLGLESFIFLDDNPMEIAEVQTALPQVLCLQFPLETKQIETFIDHIWYFDRVGETFEDHQRTQWYQQNLKREQQKSTAPTYLDFLNQLDLFIEFSPMTPTQVDRVSQLTQRTNQFNSTTRRRDEQTIQQLAQQSEFHIECVTVKDRFGNYGLVGVMIFRFTSEKAVIDSFLVSCRVLGRGVEHTMAAKAGDIALEKGLDLVEIHYRTSARNKPVLTFLEKISNLQPDQDGYHLSISSQQLAKVHFKPDQVSSVSKKSLTVTNTPSQDISSKCVSNQIEHWMSFSDINLLTQEIAVNKKERGVSSNDFKPPNTEIERKLALIWQDVLKTDSVGVETSFFDIGGTSLELVETLCKICETVDVPLPLQLFSENCTIRHIGKQIEKYKETGRFLAGESNQFPDLASEAKLPEIIKTQITQLTGLKNKAHHFTKKGKVLLTGSTGFLGAYLLKSLLEKTSDKICCLVRGKSATSGLKRIRKNMALYNLKIDPERIEVVLGDLAYNNLGLSDGEYHRLSIEVDAIYHNGAAVNFILPYDRLKPANIDGTRECIRFACINRLKPLHYISTTSVFDTGKFKSSDQIKEIGLDQNSTQVHGGYAQSKWVAEMMVTKAGEIGLPISIYRPNGIGPSLDPNHTRFNVDDAFSLMLLASLSIGAFSDLPVNIDFTPVDYVATAIVALSSKPAVGQIYALTNPTPQSLNKILKGLRQLGQDIQLIPYEQWVSKIKTYAETTENQKLLTLLPLLQEPMPSCGETWFELSSKRPKFDCSNSIRDLEDAEVPNPAINTDNIMKLLLLSFLTNNYLECIGVIRPNYTVESFSTRLPEKKNNHPYPLKKGIILTWSLGSGHNSAAHAIAATFKKGKSYDFEIIDLGDQISFVRQLKPFWTHLSRYNITQLESYTNVMQSSNQHEIVQFKTIYEVTVQQLIKLYQPQIVISVCPLGSQLLRYFKNNSLEIKTVTYVSDWFGGNYKDWGDEGADWIYSPSKECTHYLTEHFAKIQPNIHEKITTGSLIIRNGDKDLSTEYDRSRLRKKWNIKSNEKVLLFNSYGNEQVIELLENIPLESPHFQVMVLCYNNEEVLKKVNALKNNFPGKIEGCLWLDNLNEWLLVSDVLFSKPGPGICAEALINDTVIFLNALDGVMPQEVDVYKNLIARQLGFGIKTEVEFAQTLQDWLGTQTRYNGMLNRVKNQTIHNGCEDFCRRIVLDF
jgi:FkbH-like protein/thioester reductase-like protein